MKTNNNSDKKEILSAQTSMQQNSITHHVLLCLFQETNDLEVCFKSHRAVQAAHIPRVG